MKHARCASIGPSLKRPQILQCYLELVRECVKAVSEVFERFCIFEGQMDHLALITPAS